jgi:repressor LexA
MLTARQSDVYRFIRDFIAAHGQGPLLAEIAEGVGMRSKGTVHRYVQSLVQAGWVEWMPGRHRGIRLARGEGDPEGAGCSIPLLGKIAAGRPIEAIAGQDTLNLADFFMGRDRFVLRVQGDSMVQAGILDGDMVVVEKRQRAENGAIVVALIDNDEATLKRIRYNRDGSITLVPANPELAPTTYGPERVQVQGVVVGQMRSYR